MEGHDTEATAQNSENISRIDKFAAAQMKFDSTLKEEAFLLPSMAASDLEKNKKTLVLDLDDTLIHSTYYPEERFDFFVEFHTEEGSSVCYVLKRPGLENLLQELTDLYEIVVFTAGGSIYANAILDELDPWGRIKHRLTRENCTELPGIPAVFVKDLSKLGRDLKNIIFVDDRPYQCFQSENAYPITAFTDDIIDTELFDLVDFCKRVAVSTSDVREEIRQVTNAMSASLTGFLSDVGSTGKKTLVVRLEGVLVYSTWDSLPCFDFTVDGDYNRRTRYVLKRPGLDRLVAELAELYVVVVFSIDDEDYANGILDRLDPSQTVFPPTQRLFQRNYTSALGRHSCQVILVDVADEGFSILTPNMYPVLEFKDDMSDETLFELTDFCKRVAYATSDVRVEILFHFCPPIIHTSAGWVECGSRSIGTHYYYNVITKQTTWQRPPLLMPKEEYDALWEKCTSHDADTESTISMGEYLALEDNGDMDENMMRSSSSLEEGRTSTGGCDGVVNLSQLCVMFDDYFSLGAKGKKDQNEKSNKEVNLGYWKEENGDDEEC